MKLLFVLALVAGQAAAAAINQARSHPPVLPEADVESHNGDLTAALLDGPTGLDVC